MKRFVIPTRLNVTKSKKICLCVYFDSVSPFCPCVARLHGVSKLIIFADKFGSTMNVYEIIDRFYPNDDALKNIYIIHARKVTSLALEMAAAHPELQLDVEFIEEAAMLHDIGIFLTDAPRIYCYGTADYLCHGYLGAELLRELGYERHARVCERHTGTGLRKEQIVSNGWNLPVKDFVPETLEEQLVCFADKFYSKTKHLEQPRTLDEVVESMRRISEESTIKVQEWAAMFL